MKKSKCLLFIMYTILLAVNIIPVIIFRSRARISIYSIPAIFMIVQISLRAIFAYGYRHKYNLLLSVQPMLLSSDQEYTFSPEYMKEFKFTLIVHCAVIPFCIPFMFFASTTNQAFLVLLLFFVPFPFYLIYSIIETIPYSKEVKAQKEKLKQELKEQQQREELGHWK